MSPNNFQSFYGAQAPYAERTATGFLVSRLLALAMPEITVTFEGLPKIVHRYIKNRLINAITDRPAKQR